MKPDILSRYPDELLTILLTVDGQGRTAKEQILAKLLEDAEQRGFNLAFPID